MRVHGVLTQRHNLIFYCHKNLKCHEERPSSTFPNFAFWTWIACLWLLFRLVLHATFTLHSTSWSGTIPFFLLLLNLGSFLPTIKTCCEWRQSGVENARFSQVSKCMPHANSVAKSTAVQVCSTLWLLHPNPKYDAHPFFYKKVKKRCVWYFDCIILSHY